MGIKISDLTEYTDPIGSNPVCIPMIVYDGGTSEFYTYRGTRESFLYGYVQSNDLEQEVSNYMARSSSWQGWFPEALDTYFDGEMSSWFDMHGGETFEYLASSWLGTSETSAFFEDMIDTCINGWAADLSNGINPISTLVESMLGSYISMGGFDYAANTWLSSSAVTNAINDMIDFSSLMSSWLDTHGGETFEYLARSWLSTTEAESAINDVIDFSNLMSYWVSDASNLEYLRSMLSN